MYSMFVAILIKLFTCGNGLVEDVDVEHSALCLVALCCQALKETGNADWSIPGGTEAMGIP